jgi:hypothetical protein
VYALKPVFDWTDLVIAVVLACTALPLYFVSQLVAPQYYWLVHSVWHTVAAVAQFYLLETRSRVHSGLWQVSRWPAHTQRHDPDGHPSPDATDGDAEHGGDSASLLQEPWGLRGHSLLAAPNGLYYPPVHASV